MAQSEFAFSYVYDDAGNITQETRNGLNTVHTYDLMGQLTQVKDPHQQKTLTYQYDRGGNQRCPRCAWGTAVPPTEPP